MDADPSTLREFLVVFTPYAVLAISVVLACFATGRGLLRNALLCGLTGMTVVKPSVSMATGMDGVSKKQEKRLAAQLKGAAANHELRWGEVETSLLAQLEFTDELDLLAVMGLLLLVNIGTAVAARWHGGPTLSLVSYLVVAGATLLLAYMAKVEWLHPSVGRTDKRAMVVLALAGAGLACGVLAAPPSALPFNVPAAAEELAGRVHAAVVARSPWWTDKDVPLTPAPVALAVPLAVVAGALSALLLGPGLRYGRVLHMLLSPPLWAANFKPSVAGKPLWTMVARLGFVAELLVVPLWVVPLTDVLALPAEALPYVRGGGLLLAGLLQAGALSTLAQTFLLTAPYAVDVILSTPEWDATTRSALVKQQCTLTLRQLSKAALQLAGAAGGEQPPAAAAWVGGRSELFACVSGFIGWWAALSHVFWGSLGALMARLAGSGE
ncbi:hypothetical protein HT031_000426 [Scenedesmus sp. PABB004]|nr:hypothetical protein HT031_000426 [Scenedesmus sp. PABB004]